MSVASEIQRINTAVANAYTAISGKGGTLPATQNVAGLQNAISSIPSGSTDDGTGWVKPTAWPDIKSIINDEDQTSYGIPSTYTNKYIVLLQYRPGVTLTLNKAKAYRTSDGSVYSSNATHTFSSDYNGTGTVWFIAYSDVHDLYIADMGNMNAASLWFYNPDECWLINNRGSYAEHRLILNRIDIEGETQTLFGNYRIHSISPRGRFNVIASDSLPSGHVRGLRYLPYTYSSTSQTLYMRDLPAIKHIDYHFDTSTVTSGYFFYNCSSIEELPDDLDLSGLASTSSDTFANLSQLKKAPIRLKINCSFRFLNVPCDSTTMASFSTVGGAVTVTGGFIGTISASNLSNQTITLSNNYKASLSADQLTAVEACLVAKNWNVAWA